MTDQEIDAMPPGREMDEATWNAAGISPAEPRFVGPSEEIEIAMYALQSFVDARPGWWYILSSCPNEPGSDAEISHEDRCWIGRDKSPGLPGLAVAICRAILKAAKEKTT